MPKGIAAALAVEVVVLGAIMTIALDMYAHKRVERVGGVNIWGYRGPVLRHRAPNEIRIAIVGGDAAFGWGVAASVTPGQYAAWIGRFAYLQPDIVCLIVDPRQHVARSRALPDRESVAFAAFG